MRISTFNTRMLMTFFAFSIFLSASAQTAAPLDVTVSTASNGSGTVNVICYVLLQDTTATSQIQVQLGSMSDSTDIANYSFVFDQTSGLPSGYSYIRNGNNLTLNVGTIADVLTFFGRVRIKDSSGSWGDYFRFISN